MRKMRFWLMPFFFLPVSFLFILLYIFASDCFYRFSPRSYERFGIYCFRMFVKSLRIQFRYHRRHDFPLPMPAIYICNHSTSFEVFIMTMLLQQTHYVIDADVLKIPILNKILKKGPLIFVDRRSPKSRADCIKQMGEKLKQGRNVMLFPEGRSHKFLGERFATGAFRAAIEYNVPIVPLYLHYSPLEAFVPDIIVDHKKEFFRIINTPNKMINAYSFSSLQPKKYPSAVEFRDEAYLMYLQWQREFYGQVP